MSLLIILRVMTAYMTVMTAGNEKEEAGMRVMTAG